MNQRPGFFNTVIRSTRAFSFLCFLNLCLLITPTAHAATINATSCNSSDVQAAITAAVDGDTVQIPAGTCTWTSGITVTKSIAIIGAGENQTIISDEVPDGFGSALFWMYPASLSANMYETLVLWSLE